ncbi:nucleoside hydrolase [Actinomyces sp. B33]|uniref:nucleoside hydrolase n=1 Tax=Actinomyces sp. B33 TaxID=2942131 RepID=UPI00234104AA|nr:nucleoside hydrolase [Actinomyces sp. B33]MDC4232241.1 nucleoside hydrolase [Actinomyces sp. B33]
MTAQLILDTDIGTDVDDALALALILGSPELSLRTVTTVYGDTVLRAKLASRLCTLSGGSASPEIIAGQGETLSGRDVWWPGHEGTQFVDLNAEDYGGRIDAVDHLVTEVLNHPGEIDVLAVGPLTNIAEAMRREPDFASAMRGLYIMGGDFRDERRIREHNFLCDATAADEVFRSGARITVTGLDVTETIAFRPEQVERIRNAGLLGRALGAEIDIFWNFHGKPWNNPHDAITALTLVRPDLFDAHEARVRIEASGVDAGLVIDDSDAALVTVIDRAKSERVCEELVARIIAAA